MIENINTMYIETPGFTPLGIFLKAGWSEMDVRTKEDLEAAKAKMEILKSISKKYLSLYSFTQCFLL